ncbi:hypothetical protein D3C73_1509530 [compost metagenome]
MGASPGPEVEADRDADLCSRHSARKVVGSDGRNGDHVADNRGVHPDSAEILPQSGQVAEVFDAVYFYRAAAVG